MEKKNVNTPADSARCCIGCLDQENEQFAQVQVTQVACNIVLCGSEAGSATVNAAGNEMDIEFDDDGNLWVNGEKLDPEEVNGGVKVFSFKNNEVDTDVNEE